MINKAKRKLLIWIKNIILTNFDMYLVKSSDGSDIERLIRKLHAKKVPLIRLGNDGDGGYLVPNDLIGIEALFSPGVGKTSEFENDIAKKNINVFMADASVSSPCMDNKRFNFLKKFVGSSSYDNFITMDDWVGKAKPLRKDSDLMLQMDIEGFEYETILRTSDSLMKRFRIMVFELHRLDLLFIDTSTGSIKHNLLFRFFYKILQTHECVHIHMNNNSRIFKKGDIHIPEAMEFTFLRKDRVNTDIYTNEPSHELDVDNNRKKPHLGIPRCWYK